MPNVGKSIVASQPADDCCAHKHEHSTSTLYRQPNGAEHGVLLLARKLQFRFQQKLNKVFIFIYLYVVFITRLCIYFVNTPCLHPPPPVSCIWKFCFGYYFSSGDLAVKYEIGMSHSYKYYYAMLCSKWVSATNVFFFSIAMAVGMTKINILQKRNYHGTTISIEIYTRHHRSFKVIIYFGNCGILRHSSFYWNFIDSSRTIGLKTMRHIQIRNAKQNNDRNQWTNNKSHLTIFVR